MRQIYVLSAFYLRYIVLSTYLLSAGVKSDERGSGSVTVEYRRIVVAVVRKK